MDKERERFWVLGFRWDYRCFRSEMGKKKEAVRLHGPVSPKGEFLIRKLAKNIHCLIRQCKANINFK